jgi:hypothetical protein
MRTKAERRETTARAKQKAKRLLKSFGFGATPQQVGRWAGTHCRPCSCDFCSTHWDGVFRFKGVKTREKGEV